MKNLIISLAKDGKQVIYLAPGNYESTYALHHKLRIKSALFGCIFTTYHPEMDFTYCLSLGWEIVTDNRPIGSAVTCT